jgi:hypothetical protein
MFCCGGGGDDGTDAYLLGRDGVGVASRKLIYSLLLFGIQ